MTGVYRLALVALAALAAGCTTTRPPEDYPELVTEQTPRESLCTVREADHCFVGYVDGVYLTQFDVNPIAAGTYRQLRLPAGPHTLAVFYREQRNLETIVSGPRFVTVDAQPGRTYQLKANLVGLDTAFADTLPTANWRPALVDSASKEQVAIAPTNR